MTLKFALFNHAKKHNLFHSDEEQEHDGYLNEITHAAPSGAIWYGLEKAIGSDYIPFI